MHKRIIFSFFLLTLLGLIQDPQPVLSSDNNNTRQSFLGLKGLFISVEKIDPEVEKDGLDRDQLTEHLAQKLRQAGIDVLSKEMWFDEKGSPFLYVNANILKLKTTKEYVYSLRIALRQDVYSAREPLAILGAATWDPGGIVGITTNLDKIRQAILKQVDRFIKTYHTINAK